MKIEREEDKLNFPDYPDDQEGKGSQEVDSSNQKDPDAPVMFLTLDDGTGEAVFRMPYVGDLRIAETKPGAIAISSGVPVFKLAYHRELLRNVCLVWGKSGSMPPAELIDGIDDDSMIEMLNELQASLTKRAIKLIEEGTKKTGITIKLTTGDVIEFKRPSQKDKEELENTVSQLENSQYQIVEANILTAIAVTVSWNDAPSPLFGDLHNFYSSLNLEDYTRIAKATEYLFRRQGNKKAFRFS